MYHKGFSISNGNAPIHQELFCFFRWYCQRLQATKVTKPSAHQSDECSIYSVEQHLISNKWFYWGREDKELQIKITVTALVGNEVFS